MTTTKRNPNWGGRRPNAGPKRKSIKLSIDEIAYQVYLECFGHLDDKNFQAEKTGEIHDWLANGDLSNNRTLESIIAEWREYDSDDPNIH